MKIEMLELFAGIGGFRLASEELGIKTIWANDIDSNAAQIYQTHFRNGTFIQDDIRKCLASIATKRHHTKTSCSSF